MITILIFNRTYAENHIKLNNESLFEYYELSNTVGRVLYRKALRALLDLNTPTLFDHLIILKGYPLN